MQFPMVKVHITTHDHAMELKTMKVISGGLIKFSKISTHKNKPLYSTSDLRNFELQIYQI